MPNKRPLPASVVLVVEDDELVRSCAVLMLEEAGFAVIEAANADEAWDVLGARADVGVLFTDVDMPGSMCGRTLAERVHRAWPDIRLVLTSGRQRFTEAEVPDHGLFVPKPYDGAQVVDAIHHAGRSRRERAGSVGPRRPIASVSAPGRRTRLADPPRRDPSGTA